MTPFSRKKFCVFLVGIKDAMTLDDNSNNLASMPTSTLAFTFGNKSTPQKKIGYQAKITVHSKIPTYSTSFARDEGADFLQRTTSTVHDFNELCTLFLPILCLSGFPGRVCGSVNEALLVQDTSSSMSVSWLPDQRLLLSTDPDEKSASWLLESVVAGRKFTVLGHNPAVLASGCVS